MGLFNGKAKEQQMTGPDYLVAVGANAAENGHAYAAEFTDLVMQAFGADNTLYRAALAQRPLQDYEVAPAAIVGAAFERAMSNGDTEAAIEIVRVGMALAMKWDRWLISGEQGHPSMMLKPV